MAKDLNIGFNISSTTCWNTFQICSIEDNFMYTSSYLIPIHINYNYVPIEKFVDRQIKSKNNDINNLNDEKNNQ